MITLYHSPKSRSSRMLFLLEELGAPYTVKKVAIRRADGTGSVDAANPHPHAKVPAISDDGVIVFESSAIALYLTDKFPQNGLGPRVGDPLRGPYLSWLAYYGGVFEPAILSKFQNTPVPRGAAGWVVIEEVMEFIGKTLSASPYLLGAKFSAADILYATTFALLAGRPLLPKSPVIDGYVKACLARPAYTRAQAKDES